MAQEFEAKVAAESDSTYTQNVEVEGRVIESDGVLLTVVGQDGIRYTVEKFDEDRKVLKASLNGQTRVKGVVTEIEVTY